MINRLDIKTVKAIEIFVRSNPLEIDQPNIYGRNLEVANCDFKIDAVDVSEMNENKFCLHSTSIKLFEQSADR